LQRPTLERDNSYVPGDMVTHCGHQWNSNWFSTGADPGAPQSWNVWSDQGAG
jgi:chitodextrinase